MTYRINPLIRRREYIPDLLSSSEVQTVLHELGVFWKTYKVNSKNWVEISSPFREDKKPSFSINVVEGCFIDRGRPNVKGDVVKLVMYAKSINRKQAERWILSTLNLNLNLRQHQ